MGPGQATQEDGARAATHLAHRISRRTPVRTAAHAVGVSPAATAKTAGTSAADSAGTHSPASCGVTEQDRGQGRRDGEGKSRKKSSSSSSSSRTGSRRDQPTATHQLAGVAIFSKDAAGNVLGRGRQEVDRALAQRLAVAKVVWAQLQQAAAGGAAAKVDATAHGVCAVACACRLELRQPRGGVGVKVDRAVGSEVAGKDGAAAQVARRTRARVAGGGATGK